MITSAEMLKKLKEISKKHFKSNPEIGIDSLALHFSITPAEVLTILKQLEDEGQVILHGHTKVYNSKGARLTESGKVSLAEGA